MRPIALSYAQFDSNVFCAAQDGSPISLARA